MVEGDVVHIGAIGGALGARGHAQAETCRLVDIDIPTDDHRGASRHIARGIVHLHPLRLGGVVLVEFERGFIGGGIEHRGSHHVYLSADFGIHRDGRGRVHAHSVLSVAFSLAGRLHVALVERPIGETPFHASDRGARAHGHGLEVLDVTLDIAHIEHLERDVGAVFRNRGEGKGVVGAIPRLEVGGRVV